MNQPLRSAEGVALLHPGDEMCGNALDDGLFAVDLDGAVKPVVEVLLNLGAEMFGSLPHGEADLLHNEGDAGASCASGFRPLGPLLREIAWVFEGDEIVDDAFVDLLSDYVAGIAEQSVN